METAAPQDDVSSLFAHIPEKRWCFFQTRPRHEKQAAHDLGAQGILVYLPLITKVEIHNRGRRERQLPMFPGYVFACPSFDEETAIRYNKYVWNIKPVSDVDETNFLNDLKIVRECELLSVKHELIVNPQIKVGDRVSLKKGPFKNQEVIVARRKDAVSVIVNLEFLGKSIEFSCNADDLVC